MDKDTPIIEEELNLKQKLFCETYTSSDKELFGNGVQSYIEVYEPDRTKPNWYDIACQSAYQILSNIKVINYINRLLEEGGFNDVNVDKQHAFLIAQHANFPVKMSAIKEYNALKKRIDNKIELILPKPILDLNVLPDDSNKQDNISKE